MYIHSSIHGHLSHKTLSVHGRWELLFGPPLPLVIADNDKDQQVSLNSLALTVMRNRPALDKIKKKIISTLIEKCAKIVIQFKHTHTKKDIQIALQQMKRFSTENTTSCPSELSRS